MAARSGIKTRFSGPVGSLCSGGSNSRKNGKQSLHVGRSAESLLNQRIHQHCIAPNTDISRWLIAVCFTGDDRNSTLGQVESRALEYLLYADLATRPGISLANQQMPTEPSLPNTKWENLKTHQQTIISLLGSFGVLLDKKVKPISKRKKSPTRYKETVSDLLAAGLLQVGEVLESSRKNRAQQAEAEIADTQGNIRLLRYTQDDNGNWINSTSKICESPSEAAGEAGIPSPNGWDFWIASSSGKTLSELRAEYQRRNLRGSSY